MTHEQRNYIEHNAATARKNKNPDLPQRVLEDFYKNGIDFSEFPGELRILDFCSGPSGSRKTGITGIDPYGFEGVPVEADDEFQIVIVADVLTNYPTVVRRIVLEEALKYTVTDGYLLVTGRNYFIRDRFFHKESSFAKSPEETATWLINDIPYHYYRPMDLLMEMDWFLGGNNSGPLNHHNTFSGYQTVVHRKRA